MTNHEYADGLRQLAEWYDAHPDAEQPYRSDRVEYFPVTKDDLVALLREHGGQWKKTTASDLLYLRRRFGPFTLEAVIDQRDVCTRRVVGTRIVPASPERLEEVVEWDCQPILGAVIA